LVGARWFVPQTLGVEQVCWRFAERWNGAEAMVLLLRLKLLQSRSATLRNAGGIFGPTLFIGAMLGGIVGTARKVSPGHVAPGRTVGWHGRCVRWNRTGTDDSSMIERRGIMRSSPLMIQTC
jgi:hypothetical protein